MSITFDTNKFSESIQELTKKFDEARYKAAQAGAQVLYDAARDNVPVSGKGHYFYGTSFKLNGKKYFFNSGTLKSSIYQVYSRRKSTEHMATYHVSWNHTKAPYGFMVEFGTKNAAAHSFIGKAIKERSDDVESAMNKVFKETVDEYGK